MRFGQLVRSGTQGEILLFLLFGAISVVAAALLVISPSAALLTIMASIALVLVLIALEKALLLYFIFIIVQDLVLNFTPDSTLTYMVLKRGDEFLLVLLLLATVLRKGWRGIPQVATAYRLLLTSLLFGVVSTFLYGADLYLGTMDVFLLLKGIIVFYLVSHVDAARYDRLRPAVMMLGAGVIALLFTLADLSLGDRYRIFIQHSRMVGQRQGLPTIVSIFGHEGVAGWFFAFCACIALAFWMVKRRPLYLVLCSSFIAGSIMSLRRKPLVGLVAVFGVAILVSAKTRTTLRTVAAVVLIGGAVAYLSGDMIVGNFEEMLDQYVYTPMPLNVARNAMLNASVQVAVDRFPFGAGFGTFGGFMAALHYSPLYYEYGLSNVPGLSEAEPRFLQDMFWPHVIAELGFIGSVLFVAALFFFVRSHWRIDPLWPQEARILSYAALFCFVESVPESVGWMVYENTLTASCIFGLLALATMSQRSLNVCRGHGRS